MTTIGNPQVVSANENADGVAGAVTRGARLLVENQDESDGLIGYVIIGIYDKGGYSCGWRIPEEHMIGRTLFTAYVKEVIERDLTGHMSAEDYVREYL